MRAVVVDLPLEPVTQTTRGGGGEAVPIVGRIRAEEQADVVINRDAEGHRLGNDLVRRGVEVGDAGGGDEGRHAIKGVLAGEVGERQVLSLGFGASFGGVVPQQGLGATRRQGSRGGNARAAKAQNGNFLAFVADDRNHARAPFVRGDHARRQGFAASA